MISLLILILPKRDWIILATKQDAHNKKAHGFHLPVTPRKIVLSYPSLVAQLIIKQKKGSVELFGKEVTNIVIPFNEDQLQVFYKIVMTGELLW